MKLRFDPVEMFLVLLNRFFSVANHFRGGGDLARREISLSPSELFVLFL